MNILDIEKEDFLFCDEINQIIFDYLQLYINEINKSDPTKDFNFMPTPPKKPYKWHSTKSSFGTLFGVLFNCGLITGNKTDFIKQLILLFENAPSESYLKDNINLKVTKESNKVNYCKETENLLSDWIEYLKTTPQNEK